MRLKFKIVSLVFVVVSLHLSFGQSIRKNYTEMTQQERDALVAAFYQLRNGPDLVNDLATFHSNFFNLDNSSDPTQRDIHFNLPDEPERDIFLAWHRMQVFEMEQAMQQIDPKISIPFWDSIDDQSTTSALWNQNFMGQFNTDWNLNRNLGGNGPLGTQADVNNLMIRTDFRDFSNTFERGNVHAGPHRWVGGAMPTTASPRDPIFYLHHCFVDKVWRDWQTEHGTSAYISTSMLRYDGTYVFGGVTLPSINPNDIVDSRALGVFYAEDELAVLDNYSVSNTYHDVENFYYQYVIEAGNNFNVPNAAHCNITSLTEVVLKPGFTAAPGSEFIASIENLAARNANPIVRNKKPFDNIEYLLIDFDTGGFKNKHIELGIYPNPFIDYVNVTMGNGKTNYSGKVLIYDILGRLVKTVHFTNKSIVYIDELGKFSDGIYIINVVDVNGTVIAKDQLVKS